MNYLKIGGSVLGALALLAAAWLIKDRFNQKDLADAAVACAKAAGDYEDDASLKSCLPELRSEVAAARLARLCDRALLPSLRPETRFAMQHSCSAGVKHMVAAADAAAAERDILAGQLTEARADSAAAVVRAETRVTRFNQRTEHARQAIQAAPRDTAGAVRCDAECLRRLSQ